MMSSQAEDCEPVDGGLGEQRVGERGEPLVGVAVGGHERGRLEVAFDDELVEVGGLGGVEGLEREVVDDEQIDADEAAHLDLVGVIEPGGAEPFEQPVGPFGVDLAAAAAGDVPERVGEVGLADPDGSEDQRRVGVVDEPQRGQLGPDVAGRR